MTQKFMIIITRSTDDQDCPNSTVALAASLPKEGAGVADEIIVEGSDMSEHVVETSICRAPGLPDPAPPKKGFGSRIFGTGQ